MNLKKGEYNPMEISDHIKELCRERGWTYYELASQCGIAQSSLSTILNRGGDPSIKTLKKICAGFDISMTAFFAGIEKKNNDYSEIMEIYQSLGKTERKFAKVYLLGLACRKE